MVQPHALGRRAPLLGCLIVLAASAVAARNSTHQDTSLSAAMATRANAFLATLDDARSKQATTMFGDAERTQWAFGPVRREGVNLAGLTADQMTALEALLDTALSEAGMRAWHEVRAEEIELRRRESTPDRVATHRDPNLYWLRVYGTPDVGARWSWRFEGHHLALHIDCTPGRTPSVTPFFVGANPLFIEDASGAEQVAIALFADLNGAYATLCDGLEPGAAAGDRSRPGDVRMGPGRDDLPPADGTALSALSAESRVNALSLLESYLALLEPALRGPYELDSADLAAVHLTRWGDSDLHGARAWALRTPRFALELVTTDGPHHVHILLRDIDRDFGGK